MNTDSQVDLMRDEIWQCMTDGCSHSDSSECYAKLNTMAEELKVRASRRFDGRALRLACIIIFEALKEDCGLETWHAGRFNELRLSVAEAERMKLYEMDLPDGVRVLVDAFRKVAAEES